MDNRRCNASAGIEWIDEYLQHDSKNLLPTRVIDPSLLGRLNGFVCFILFIILKFKLNKGSRKDLEMMTPASKERLNDFNWADKLLYEYFDAKINQYGNRIYLYLKPFLITLLSQRNWLQ